MEHKVGRRDFLTIGIAITVGASLGLHKQAMAQNYPSREIRLIVPLTPGSAVDTLARGFSNELGKFLNQAIVVENKPGADSVVATKLVQNAPPDGYTIMLVTPAHAINVHQYPSLPYDPIKDFTPIALVASNMNMLVVHSESPIRSVKDLVVRAKERPGQLNFGNGGGTSGGSAELLNYMEGIKTVNVLYKGAAGALTDLIGGRLDFVFTAISSGTPYVRSGQLRALGVTGSKRHPSLPDMPTLSETIPGYEVLGWYGLVGPAGIPKPIVETLNRALFEALKAPQVKERMARIGSDPAAPNSPDDLAAFVRSEVVKWGKVTPSRE